jgi:hypothetical protein
MKVLHIFGGIRIISGSFKLNNIQLFLFERYFCLLKNKIKTTIFFKYN